MNKEQKIDVEKVRELGSSAFGLFVERGASLAEMLSVLTYMLACLTTEIRLPAAVAINAFKSAYESMTEEEETLH